MDLNHYLGYSLNSSQAELLEKKIGKNILFVKKSSSAWKIFLRQFQDITIYILILASVLSFFIQDNLSGLVIFFIVVLVALFGFVQEYSAEKAMDELEKMISPKVLCLRDHRKVRVDVTDLVPGDIIVLKRGDVIAADSVVIYEDNLSVNESVITGESTDVFKSAYSGFKQLRDKILSGVDVSPNKLGSSFLYAGSSVTSGEAVAMVVKTGKNTAFGKIAKHLTDRDDQSIFQKKILLLSKKVSFFISVVILLVFFLKLFELGVTERNIVHLIIFSVAISVAAIPEGLPIVVTITFALGAQRMARKNAIVRKLSSIDGLGSSTVICTDKTGTLTKNKLVLKKVYFPDIPINYSLNDDEHVLKAIYFLDTAEEIHENGKDIIVGNSVDVALRKYLKSLNISLDFDGKIIKKIPFDSRRKYSVVVVEGNDGKHTYVKGAPEYVLKMCNAVRVGSKYLHMTDHLKNLIESRIHFFTSSGYHTIGFAELINGEITFMGLVGLEDEMREGIPEVIQSCHDAGIRVILITGDHVNTAKKVALDAGIPTDHVITGDEISKLSFDELKEKMKKVTVCARVKPEDKFNVVKALKANNEIVTMTGDGVNDVPALKKADVGVAMGSGTEIAKQTADVVLKDDNFITLVEAVKEGRNIYFNLRKYLGYQFSINLSEILILIFAVILHWPFPLTALQLLFVNIILDDIVGITLTSISLGDKVMKKKTSNDFLQKPLPQLVSFFGILITVFVLGAFHLGDSYSVNIGQLLAFITLAVLGVLQAINYASFDRYSWQSLFINKALLSNVIISLIFGIFAFIFLKGSTVIPVQLYYYPLFASAFLLFSMDVLKYFYLKKVEIV